MKFPRIFILKRYYLGQQNPLNIRHTNLMLMIFQFSQAKGSSNLGQNDNESFVLLVLELQHVQIIDLSIDRKLSNINLVSKLNRMNKNFTYPQQHHLYYYSPLHSPNRNAQQLNHSSVYLNNKICQMPLPDSNLFSPSSFPHSQPNEHFEIQLSSSPRKHLFQDKQHTLPHYLSSQKLGFSHSPFLTRTNSTILNYRISFTYISPSHSPISPKNSISSTSQFSILERNLENKANANKAQKVLRKRMRNKVCSREYYFAHYPQRKDCTSIITEQPCLNIAKNTTCQSKMASTIATNSFHENRTSNLSYQQHLSHLLSNQRLSNHFDTTTQNLQSIVPADKQLGKTIFIQNNQNYSFGGIIHQTPTQYPLSFKKRGKDLGNLNFQSSLQGRQWNNHVKCLIGSNMNDLQQNLKHSIHQGPEIKREHYKFQLLNDFGRQIKQSTMELHE